MYFLEVAWWGKILPSTDCFATTPRETETVYHIYELHTLVMEETEYENLLLILLVYLDRI